MDVALHSWSFRQRFKDDPSFDVFQALDLTAEMGFGAIEIMAGKAGGPRFGDFASDDPVYLRQVMAHAGRAGVRVTCLSTYNDFAFVQNEEWRLANIAFIKRWLAIAGDLGVPNIRMLTGYMVEGEDRGRLERLAWDGIAECVPHAERAGVNMAIENHNSLFFGADEILHVIAGMGSTRVTACPDPSNWSNKTFWDVGCPHADRELVFAGAAALAPKATQSHLKIRGFDDEGRLIGWGDGIERLLRIYHDARYRGVLAFESIVMEGDLLEPLPRARQLVEGAIARVTAAAAASA